MNELESQFGENAQAESRGNFLFCKGNYVQTQAQPVQPSPFQQSRSIPPSRGKVKPPKKGGSGEQEIGIVQ